LLEALSWERLMKKKGLASAVVIYKLWRLSVAL
jgi:hypothetical protein